jgi:ABC-2 type transport system ATP-binding protein
MGIAFDRVSFSFNETKVLEEISLSFGEGITAVMGENGAGKTTLLQLAAGILTPVQGQVKIEDESYRLAGSRLRRNLGFMPQSIDFPEHLTPRKLLTYLTELRFLDPGLGLLELERLGMARQADRRFETLSMGEIRLVGLAQALMGEPSFLILDEFTRNLSIEDRQMVFRRLAQVTPERVVIFSTHLCEDVAALAGRVILLSSGKVGFSGSPAGLIRLAAGHVFQVEGRAGDLLRLAGKVQVSRQGQTGGKEWIRVVGDLPEGLPGRAVEPTFEEACLWFFRPK